MLKLRSVDLGLIGVNKLCCGVVRDVNVYHLVFKKNTDTIKHAIDM